MDKERIERAIRDILIAVGENPDREGLKETPRRVAKLYEEIFSGLQMDLNSIMTVFETENHDEMVILKDISFYSLCEHHLLPFFGKVHIAYLPNKNCLAGLSKLARVVDVMVRRPQLQERITTQIADKLMEMLNPLGVLVMIEAEHLCMTMRGIKKPGSQMMTSAVRGIFLTSIATRMEALHLIGK